MLVGITENLPRGATGWLTLVGIGAGFVLLWLVLRRLVPNRIIRAGVLAVPLLALAWWVLSPLVIDKRVDESLLQASDQVAAQQPGAPAATAPKAPDAAAPAPEAVAGGPLSGIGHRAMGRAAVYRVEGGHVVRLEDVDLQNGPDLFVYLVPRAGQENDAGAVNLGRLKGNQGNQNYPVPAGVDLSEFRTVLIGCRQFSVPFANATLA